MALSHSPALENTLSRLEDSFTRLEYGVVQWQMRQNEVTQAALVRLDGVLSVLEPLLEDRITGAEKL